MPPEPPLEPSAPDAIRIERTEHPFQPWQYVVVAPNGHEILCDTVLLGRNIRETPWREGDGRAATSPAGTRSVPPAAGSPPPPSSTPDARTQPGAPTGGPVRRLRIVVATPEQDCVAARTLRAEQVNHEIALLPPTDEFAYGRLLADLWRDPIGFVLVEHDIAPWPGATAALEECPARLCVHRYHRWVSESERAYGHSLGLAKFRGPLLTQHPLPDVIRETPWREVDSLLWATSLRYAPVCVHEPGVAHARR